MLRKFNGATVLQAVETEGGGSNVGVREET